MLDDRKRQILQAIINDYINTAEPIGSRTIARKYDLGVSPATIRNEMADLELLGYLEQLHTSSGRIPSAKGYRFYVDALLSPVQLTDKDVQLIKAWYNTRVRSLEQVFQETVKIISRMTRNISLFVVPELSKCSFKYMQFLPLDEERAILIIVTSTGLVENTMIDIPDGLAFEDLLKIAAQINTQLSGMSLESIKHSVLHQLKNDVVPNPRLFDTLLEFIRQAMDVDKGKRVYLGGATQMLSQPEFRDIEKVKGLLTMLEEEKLLCDILHTQDQEGIVVTIGQENKYSGIQDCSVVQATYRVDGEVIGTLAVLGPTRMEYAKIMSVLEFMHRHLGEILKKYKV